MSLRREDSPVPTNAPTTAGASSCACSAGVRHCTHNRFLSLRLFPRRWLPETRIHGSADCAKSGRFSSDSFLPRRTRARRCLIDNRPIDCNLNPRPWPPGTRARAGPGARLSSFRAATEERRTRKSPVPIPPDSRFGREMAEGTPVSRFGPGENGNRGPDWPQIGKSGDYKKYY